MQGTLKRLDGTGHTVFAWDTEKPETVKTAMDEFEQALAQGAQAFDTSSPAGGVALHDRKTLPTDIASVTMVPRLAGG